MNRAEDKDNMVDETRCAFGGQHPGSFRKRSNVQTPFPRLGLSQLLAAGVAAILLCLVTIVRAEGARPGDVGRQEGLNAPGVRIESLPEVTVKPAWENAPRMDLVCRTFSDSLKIFWNIFYPTYLTFWPIEDWATSNVVVVLDGDSEQDHRLGTILSSFKLLSKINVKYEAPPLNGTTCSTWRREGYARQQYSNFYVDLYTDADFVAIIDSDSGFLTPVVPSDLFEDGKPIVTGLNAKGRWQSNVTRQAVGGGEGVGTFMTKYAFPVILKSDHLVQMRADIASNLGVATFEEAFHMICSGGKYSQFDIMFNYLWNYKNDEYSWHMANPSNGYFKNFGGQTALASTDVSVTAKDVPVVMVMHHFGKSIDSIGPADFYDNICVGSENVAGNCDEGAGNIPKMRSQGELVTAMWSPPNYSWKQTYGDHMRSVSMAASAFVWHRETNEDWIFPG